MFAQAGRLTGMITKTDIVALSTAHFVHRGALAEEKNPDLGVGACAGQIVALAVQYT
jgi:hypothetical protein